MTRSWEELTKASNEQLIAEHDKVAKNTGAGTGYYVAEINRRELRSEAEASRKLARWALVLSIVNAVLAAVAVIVAVIALGQSS